MMKSIIQDYSTNLLSFPCLMKSKVSDLVVLFTSDSNGVVVNTGGSVYKKIGEASDDWELGSFVKFNGSLTLSND